MNKRIQTIVLLLSAFATFADGPADTDLTLRLLIYEIFFYCFFSLF